MNDHPISRVTRCDIVNPESGQRCVFSGHHTQHITRGPEGTMQRSTADGWVDLPGVKQPKPKESP